MIKTNTDNYATVMSRFVTDPAKSVIRALLKVSIVMRGMEHTFKLKTDFDKLKKLSYLKSDAC